MVPPACWAENLRRSLRNWSDRQQAELAIGLFLVSALGYAYVTQAPSFARWVAFSGVAYILLLVLVVVAALPRGGLMPKKLYPPR